MTQVTKGYVELDGGKLYYEVAGEGEPLVLAHAGFVDSRMWDDQWQVFSQHFRVIRFDLRGFGKSDPSETPVTRRDDLYRLLKHLNLKRAALLGCSLSGEISLDLALERPELVTALIVVSTVPGGFELQGEPPRYLLEMMAAMAQGDVALASELQNRIWMDGPFRPPEAVDPRLRQRAAEMNRIALTHMTWLKMEAAPFNPLQPPASHRLHQIGVPTLIIAGGLDHPEILRAADVMTHAIPGAKKVILPNCAHLPNMEQPEPFTQVVLDFLISLKS